MMKEEKTELNQILTEYPHACLLRFRINLPEGAVNGALFRQGFHMGITLLKRQLESEKIPLLLEETKEPEGLSSLILDAPPGKVRQMALDIEGSTPCGKLYSMEIRDEEAGTVFHIEEGMPADAAAYLVKGIRHFQAEEIAQKAVRSLLYEVTISPKPGLVDRFGNGSHKDMNIYTFLRSASSLWPYFYRCALCGMETAGSHPTETFHRLRPEGRLAEGAMLEATEGVNTHKGAIFSLGLVCGAMGRLDEISRRIPEAVLKETAAMAESLREDDAERLKKENARTAGEKLYAEGISGVRGQAMDGFSNILKSGLPILEEGLLAGKTIDEAGSAALIALIGDGTDTNLIARSNIETAKEMYRQAKDLSASVRYPDRERLEAMDRDYISENLSPGGSADLLALSLLLHFMRTEGN